MNAFLDFLIGIVPFIGDYGDALFKANTKNVRLLELRLDEVYKPQAGKERAKQEQMTNHPPAPATVYEDFSDPEDSELPPPTGAAKKKSQRSKNRRATGRSGGQDIEMGVQT